jgi:signal transduction histidine kinase
MGAVPVPVPGLAPPPGPASPRGTAQRLWSRLRLSGPHPGVLIAVILLVSGAVCALLQGPLWGPHPLLAAVNVATSVTFICTGLILYRDPRTRAVAWALIIAGALRSVDFTDPLGGPWPFYTLVFGGMDRLAGAYALLRYPEPRLTRPQRVFLILLGTWMVIGRTLATVISTPRWDGYPASSWWISIHPDRQLAQFFTVIVNVGQGVLGLTLLVLLILRLVRTRGLDRLVITPIIVAGLAAVAAASGTAIVQMLNSINETPNNAYIVEGIVDLALPLAFGVAVVQSALLLRSIPGLTAQVSTGADVDSVRYALRTTLRDPTLEVLDLTEAGQPGPAPAAAPPPRPPAGEPPAAGEPVPPAASGEGPALDVSGAVPPDRLVELIRTEGGTPIAVVIADPGLDRYRGLFNAAVQTSGLALKNAQLQARAAQAELGQVRAVAARLVEAGLAERRRLERDLHDGAQQHLLALAAQLTAAMTRTTDPAAAEAFRQARNGLTEILAELRDFAHGIHPAVLTEGGLAAALEEVAERLPLPVLVTAPATRAASSAAEATGYFVVCEALANVVKHARASRATVDIRMPGGALEVTISDDGIGGATACGGGMSNMRDRAHALDGELTVDSPPGQGTTITVRIPCG